MFFSALKCLFPWIGVLLKLCKYLLCNPLMAILLLQVGQLREVSSKAHNAELKLFLEVELGLVMLFYQ